MYNIKSNDPSTEPCGTCGHLFIYCYKLITIRKVSNVQLFFQEFHFLFSNIQEVTVMCLVRLYLWRQFVSCQTRLYALQLSYSFQSSFWPNLSFCFFSLAFQHIPQFSHPSMSYVLKRSSGELPNGDISSVRGLCHGKSQLTLKTFSNCSPSF